MTSMPNSMDECLYFTRRTYDNNGSAAAWVIKQDCPECGKAKMGKPVDKKSGKAKIRSKEYSCPSCNFSVDKTEYEPSLSVEIDYKCPSCGNEGHTTTPYKRMKFHGVDAYVFQCEKCSEKIGLTKKMKGLKK